MVKISKVNLMGIGIVFEQMVKLFILMCLGYFLNKIKVMDDDFNTKLTKLLLYVTTPALTISSVLNQDVRNVSETLYVFVIAIVIFIILPIVGFIIVKAMRIPKNQQGMYIFMTVFSNIGFMGFPIMDALYGEKAVFYTAIFNLIFCALVFTAGVAMMNYGEGKKNKIDPKSFISPGVVSAVAAIVIYFINVSPPAIICETIDMVGCMNTPLAMIVMGSILAKINIKEVFTDKTIYIFTVLKQLVLPLALAPLLKLFMTNEYVYAITIVMLSMPVGNITVLLATQNGKDAQLAAKNIFITTLISMVTIPLILHFVL